MKILVKWAIVVSNAFLLIACSPPMPDLNVDSNQNAEMKQHFKWEERKPLRKVKLAGNFFISEQLDSNLPKDIGDIEVSLRFHGRVATLGDIVFLLEKRGIPVSYNWTVYEDVSLSESSGPAITENINTDDEMSFFEEDPVISTDNNNNDPVNAINVLEDRIVPFKTYKGTLKGLLNRLRGSMNVSYWWEDGAVFLSTNQEYVVSVPQQQDIIESISSEIEALGATNISSSLTAGQIVYYAKPRAQKNLIEPFLQRISHNLSEITLQVALVQVEINSHESKGFDWNAFNLKIDSPSAGTENTNGINISPYNGDTSNPMGNMSGSFFRKGISIFGTKTDVTVDLAINILSTIGKTTTEQNVEMRTISGKEVSLESVREESYVSGYDGGSYGDNPEPPSPEFDTVETGLVLTFLPVFDAYNAIVTIDSSIELSDRLSDTVVDAGGEFGEVSVRPNIKKDTLKDIVRIPVGETVIVGGLINESFNDKRTAPMGAWDVNSAKLSSTKQALFLIIRPLITLYETDGNELGISEEYIEDKTKYNYNKALDKKLEDEKKAKEKAAAEKQKQLKESKEKINKKAEELKKAKDLREKQEADMMEKIERVKAEFEAKQKATIEHHKEEKEKLKAEVEEHKKARAVLESEQAWTDEVIDTKQEEIPDEVEVVIQQEVDIPLSDSEKDKIKMLNMLRGLKK